MNCIIDTGFWFGLYDKNDSPEYHKAALRIAPRLETFNKIILPWPSLYETLNTKFIKNPNWRLDFKRRLVSRKYETIDDAKYRENCIENIFSNGRRSLVDQIICSMLNDINLKIDVVITFNTGDFDEYCRKCRIEVINEFYGT
jgi:hypothetical protein